MNAWWSAGASWLVDVYAMATVVLAAALITLSRLRQPARRVAVARWALLVLLFVPPLAMLAQATKGSSAVPNLELAEACYCDISGTAASGRLPALITSYVIGSALVVAWLVLGALATARLGKRTTEAPASIRTLLERVVASRSVPPRLRVGGVTQPVALGLLRPTIVLPDWFVESEPEGRVEAALAHEWAHLRRGDLWSLAASRLLFVVLFAHPLFYMLRGRLRADQEAVADAEAAGPAGNLAYAEALVGWARRTSSRSVGSTMGLLGRSSLLRKRIALLLDTGFRVEPACPRGWTVAVRVSAAALVIVLSVLASTGVARTALSALVPVPQPAVPHTHSSAPTALGCPAESVQPTWLEACKPVGLRCGTNAK